MEVPQGIRVLPERQASRAVTLASGLAVSRSCFHLLRRALDPVLRGTLSHLYCQYLTPCTVGRGGDSGRTCHTHGTQTHPYPTPEARWSLPCGRRNLFSSSPACVSPSLHCPFFPWPRSAEVGQGPPLPWICTPSQDWFVHFPMHRWARALSALPVLRHFCSPLGVY